jgi:hypothetical protein
MIAASGVAPAEPSPGDGRAGGAGTGDRAPTGSHRVPAPPHIDPTGARTWSPSTAAGAAPRNAGRSAPRCGGRDAAARSQRGRRRRVDRDSGPGVVGSNRRSATCARRAASSGRSERGRARATGVGVSRVGRTPSLCVSSSACGDESAVGAHAKTGGVSRRSRRPGPLGAHRPVEGRRTRIGVRAGSQRGGSFAAPDRISRDQSRPNRRVHEGRHAPLERLAAPLSASTFGTVPARRLGSAGGTHCCEGFEQAACRRPPARRRKIRLQLVGN